MLPPRAIATLAIVSACCASGCGPGAELDEPSDDVGAALTGSAIKYIFVIAMENHSAAQIYGSPDAPYLNGLLQRYAHATDFADELPGLPSEPHYVWMVAGTNRFSDVTFTGDGDPSASNSTASHAHLAHQIRVATNGASWRAYEEGLSTNTGACPVRTAGFYGAKHDPFVFFRDVSGAPPSKTDTYCAKHHRPLSALSQNLLDGKVAAFNFITPNVCHDMHGGSGCPTGTSTIRAGDDFLRETVPPLIQFAAANEGVVFITWDEPASSGTVPLFVIGPHVKAGYASSKHLTHSAMLKSIEQVLELPLLATVASANSFKDFFEPGFYP